MGFIDSYKHLEKLCGEVLSDDRCVSAYIDTMKGVPNGELFVPGWENDLKKLKHYRWIRNKISHEPGCTEENMCVPEDARWINGFYGRIINQTDPLALYRKSAKCRHVQYRRHADVRPGKHIKRKKRSHGGLLAAAVILLAVALAMFYFYGYVPYHL